MTASDPSHQALQLIMTDYASRATEIRSIREQVFVIEQAVPRELEVDERDAILPHALVYANQQAVGTGRIDLEKGGKVGRVAVLASHRGRGVGTAVMQALEQYAHTQGAPRVWCHAQLHAQLFYERLGYSCCGEVFEEAQIPHIRMEKQLA